MAAPAEPTVDLERVRALYPCATGLPEPGAEGDPVTFNVRNVDPLRMTFRCDKKWALNSATKQPGNTAYANPDRDRMPVFEISGVQVTGYFDAGSWTRSQTRGAGQREQLTDAQINSNSAGKKNTLMVAPISGRDTSSSEYAADRDFYTNFGRQWFLKAVELYREMVHTDSLLPGNSPLRTAFVNRYGMTDEAFTTMLQDQLYATYNSGGKDPISEQEYKTQEGTVQRRMRIKVHVNMPTDPDHPRFNDCVIYEVRDVNGQKVTAPGSAASLKFGCEVRIYFRPDFMLKKDGDFMLGLTATEIYVFPSALASASRRPGGRSMIGGVVVQKSTVVHASEPASEPVEEPEEQAVKRSRPDDEEAFA